MKNNGIRFATMISGALIACAIVLSQFFQFQFPHSIKKDVATEQHEDQPSSGQEELYFSQLSPSAPAATHGEVSQESFYLLEIISSKSDEENSAPRISFFSDKLFETLFRVIISPNAP